MRALLARRFPDAEIEAFDLSRSTDRGQEAQAAASSAGRKFDLLCLEWLAGDVPSLRRLLPMLVGMVSAGGCLAVEFPNDLYEPNRALMRMIAADGPWAKTLRADRQDAAIQRNDGRPVRSPQPDLRRRRYLGSDLSPRHAESVAAVVEWMETTSLAPFLAALDEADRREFLDRYAAELSEAYPALPDGGVLLRSRQLFVLAQP